MLTGLDAQKIGDLILFNTAKEPMLVDKRVVYGHTRHLCEAVRIPRKMEPLQEKAKPMVRCQVCETLVSPREATFSASDVGWLCRTCTRPVPK